MPNFKKNSDKKKKRGPRRGGKRSENKELVPLSNFKYSQGVCKDIGGFPSQMRVTLCETFTALSMGVITAPANGRSFQLNLLMANAAGYPALSLVYDNYLVTGARIEVEFSNTSATLPVRALVIPYDIDTAASLPLTIDDPFAQSQFAETRTVSIAGGGRDTVKITNSVSLSALTGIFPITPQSSTLSGFTGSVNSTVAITAPIDLWRWYISVESVTGANLALNQVYCSVKVFQEVLFFARLPRGY